MIEQSGKPILITTVCIALCSCTIHKTGGHGKGPQAFAVNAKQRFLVAKESKDSVHKFCAEPSPDVFSAISAAIEASGGSNDKARADMKLALSEAASSIGSRTETIQLLRDAMYRICELTMNGDMLPEEAAELHRRYYKSMVTLAAVAALADVARPPAVALTGNAQLSGEALAQIGKDLEPASTSTAAVPSDAKPRNVEAVAGVVDHLVTEVYADEHIRECIDVIGQHTNDQQTIDTQEFLKEASTMTDPSKIQATLDRIEKLGNASEKVRILLTTPPADLEGVHKLAKQVLSDTEPEAKLAKGRFVATKGLYDYCAAISSSLGRLVSAVEGRKDGASK